MVILAYELRHLGKYAPGEGGKEAVGAVSESDRPRTIAQRLLRPQQLHPRMGGLGGCRVVGRV